MKVFYLIKFLIYYLVGFFLSFVNKNATNIKKPTFFVIFLVKLILTNSNSFKEFYSENFKTY